MEFLSHKSRAQWPHMASGCHIGQCRSRTLPSLQKVLLDGVDLESLLCSPKQNVEHPLR